MGGCWSSPTGDAELKNFPYRHVLITGASSGIGAALAVQLSAVAGITITLIARHSERLQTVAAACRAQGATVHAMLADVCNQAAMEAAIHQAHKLSALDLVIANAGVVAQPEHHDQVPDAMREAAQTNIMGTLNTIVPALKLLKARAAAGYPAAVAVMSSVSALPANTVPFTGQLQLGMLPYAWSKQSLLMLGQGLEGELAGTGVKVFTICPGVVLTDLATSWTQLFMGNVSTPHSISSSSCSSAAPVKAADLAQQVQKAKTGHTPTVLVSITADDELSPRPSLNSPLAKSVNSASAPDGSTSHSTTGVASARCSDPSTLDAEASSPTNVTTDTSSTLPASNGVPNPSSSGSATTTSSASVARGAGPALMETSAQSTAEEELKRRLGAITPDEAAAAICQGLASGKGGVIAFPAKAVRTMKIMEKLPSKFLAKAIKKSMAKYNADKWL